MTDTTKTENKQVIYCDQEGTYWDANNQEFTSDERLASDFSHAVRKEKQNILSKVKNFTNKEGLRYKWLMIMDDWQIKADSRIDTNQNQFDEELSKNVIVFLFYALVGSCFMYIILFLSIVYLVFYKYPQILSILF